MHVFALRLVPEFELAHKVDEHTSHPSATSPEVRVHVLQVQRYLFERLELSRSRIAYCRAELRYMRSMIERDGEHCQQQEWRVCE